MAITDLPILSMIRTRMAWAQERQRVLAENVANSDTPNYRARDLAPLKVEETKVAATTPSFKLALARTEGGYIPAIGQSNSTFQSETKSSYEVRPTGNSVNLEDEMIKVSANQMDYQAVTALYSRSLNLIKTALGKRA
jgi:flagellar basal-body rod protein FlgB